MCPVYAIVRSREPPHCTDDGPWSCTEDGCPSEWLGCGELAELGACEQSFGEVWQEPPAGLGAELIGTRCLRGGCQGPPVQPPPELWVRSELIRRAGACVMPVVPTSGVVEHQYRGQQLPPQMDWTLGEFIEKQMANGTVTKVAKVAPAVTVAGDPLYVVSTRPSRRTVAQTPLEVQQKQCWRILDGAMQVRQLAASPERRSSDPPQISSLLLPSSYFDAVCLRACAANRPRCTARQLSG